MEMRRVVRERKRVTRRLTRPGITFGSNMSFLSQLLDQLSKHVFPLSKTFGGIKKDPQDEKTQRQL